MTESKAVALAQFRSASRTLLLKHGVIESDLHDVLRQLVLQACEGQPTVSVLYNACYGGYRYSPAFNQLKQLSSSQTSSLAALCVTARVRSEYFRHRVTDALLMAPFGQLVATEWPQLATMVKVYAKHQLGTVFQRLQDMAGMAADARRLEHKLTAFTNVVGRGSISDWASFKDDLQYNSAETLKQTLEQQQLGETPWSSDALDEMVASLRLKVLESREKEGGCRVILDKSFGAPFVDAMLISLCHSFPEEAAEAELKMYEHTNWSADGNGNNLTLLEALTLFGEGSFRIWCCQSTFDAGAMRHLLRCPDHMRHLQATDHVLIPRKEDEHQSGRGPQALAAWDVTLGLAAAGGAYSRLAIAQVPQLAEWQISEYDGFEGVAF